MRALAFAAALLLTGCATAPPARVEIPVPVMCRVEMPASPAWATESLAPDAGIWDQVKALLAEREQAAGYIAELRAAASSCQ